MSKNTDAVTLLEKNFDVAFAAPDGIKKLRELILSLAMQGKLVPQDPHDQPASELLQEIEKEKQKLVKEGKIKPSKPLLEIKSEKVPYHLPRSWEWIRLGNFGTWKSGTTPSRTNNAYYDGEIPWVKSGEVKQGKIRVTEEKITHEALKSCSLDLNPIGSVLVAMYGANIGEVGVLEIEATTNQAVCACKTFAAIENNFLLHLIVSLKQNFLTQGAGAAQPNISREKIINTVVPLAPIAEQRRIVAKIDKLMTRCDELEKLRGDRNQKQITVHNAALNSLLTAKDNSDFKTSWNFITQHFGELYSVKANVAELRKAILQLAVMGKLVPQDPNDQPASELLKEIEVEKQKLVKEGKIKQYKPLTEISSEEVPYEIPDSWKWSRLGTCLLKITDGTHHSPINTESGDFLYISAKNIKDDGVLLNNATRVSKEIHEEIFSRCDPEYGNILYIKDGATTGVVTINNLQEPFSMLSSVALLKQSKEIDNHYLLFALRSPFFYNEIRSGMTGVAITRVTLKKLNDSIIPLPPIAEQRRIVAKIDQLMILCDELEKQIEAANSKQTRLLNAVMARV